MKNTLAKARKHASHFINHVKKYKQHYLLGTFGSYAIIKMVLLFAAFFGLLQVSTTYAQVPVELNSGNIILPPFNCPISATTCSLAQKNIGNIAPGTFIHHTGLTYLTLDQNQIHSITSGTFIGLDSLNRLDFNFNPLTSVDPRAFSGHGALTKLYLKGSSFIIKTNTFNGLPNLDDLQLGFGAIVSIESGAFNGLSNLTYLQLTNNRIPAIESGDFMGLDNLNRLDLNGNRIISLESGGFIGLPLLNDLRLNNNLLTGIDTNAFNGLDNLFQLILNNNKIISIESGDFNGIPNVAALDLANNKITSIESEDFSLLSGLTDLYLSSNLITSIEPDDFNGPSSLTTLNLNFNQITSIESGDFNGLDTLTNLFLGFNQITGIDNGDFMGLSGLYYLSLNSNQITSIESGDFNGFSRLRNLSLGINQITSIESGDFNGISSLTELVLNGNQLTTIKSDDFILISGLTYLTLGQNQIASIETADFNGIPGVTQLFLDHNHITSLASDTFSGLSGLTWLYLPFNQITSLDPTMFLSGNGFSKLITLTLNANCSTNGTLSLPFKTGAITSTDNTNCALITGADADGYIANLTGRAYRLTGDYYSGNLGISFNYPGTTNQILANTTMRSINSNLYTGAYYKSIVEIRYDAGTSITYGGQPFTGVIHSPFLFFTGNVPGMTDVTTLMRFGALTHRIDFSQPITIKMPALGKNLGDTVQIYSSDEESIYGINGPHWNFETTATVIDYSGASYAEFTGTHASRWVFGTLVSPSCIDNDGDTYGAACPAGPDCNDNNAFFHTGNILPGELNGCNILSYCTSGDISCNISNQGITGIATNTFINYTDLQTLRLNNNLIASLESGDFNGLNNLVDLYLGSNLITSIASGDFTGLPKLTNLQLDSNQITSIENDDFSLITGLIYLNLPSNQIASLESGDFSLLHNLTYLYLSTNQIASLEKGTFNGLPLLQSLRLQSNLIASLESGDFSGLPLLNNLYLSNNNITSIETGALSGLSSLTLLLLDHNRLPSLPESFPTDVSILGTGGLTLDVNRLCTGSWSTGLLDFINAKATPVWKMTQDTNECPVPSSTLCTDISQPECDALSALYTTTNGNNRSNNSGWLQTGAVCGIWHGLTCVGGHVSQIQLSNNNLSGTITSEFNALSWLTYLELGSNQITSIATGTFNGFSSLAYLLLNGNKLTSIDDLGFSSLSSVINLGLSDNQLTSLTPGVFNGLSNATALRLTSNQITSLESGAFNGLSSLIQLFVHYNHIDAIATGAFSGLPSLTTLILNGNRLPSLPQSLFNELPSLGTGQLAIDYNKICPGSLHGNVLDFVAIKSGNPDRQTTQDTGSCPIGSFVINDNDVVTTGISVTLNISGTGMANMRFVNDDTGGSRSAREPFATSKGWMLSTIYGIKTVYAQFDTGIIEISANDTINYIDTILPTASVIYSSTGPTDQDVTVTLTGYSETLTGINATSRVFTGNGTFTFTFQDLAGNTGSYTVTITNIDKTVKNIVGGGGASPLSKDNCPNGDLSPSYYDSSCDGVAVAHAAAPTCDVSDSTYSQEITDAFTRGYTLNITNQCPITNARLYHPIIRKDLAKMISMFTIQVLNIYPDTHKIGCDAFTDINNLTDEMKFYTKTACQLNLMGLESDGTTPKKTFDPESSVPRAEFGTILSRLIYGDTYNINTGEENIYKRYEKHLNALLGDAIMTQIQDPFMLEQRGRVLLMLHRTTQKNLVERYRLVAPAHNGALSLLENTW